MRHDQPILCRKRTTRCLRPPDPYFPVNAGAERPLFNSVTDLFGVETCRSLPTSSVRSSLHDNHEYSFIPRGFIRRTATSILPHDRGTIRLPRVIHKESPVARVVRMKCQPQPSVATRSRTSKNGVFCKAPWSMIRIVPGCSTTNRRRE